MKAQTNRRKIIPFGKYKGEDLDDIVADDPAYLGWCIEEGIEFMDNLTSEQTEICEEAYAENDRYGGDDPFGF